jgi:hypothetical protein
VLDDEQQKTYSIWWILAVILVLGGVGLAMVILSGAEETSPTRQLPSDPSTVSTTSSTTTSSVVPPTFPGGAPAPERIEKVLSSPGKTTYIYRLPAGFTDQASTAVVAPAVATPANGGAAVTVAMACAVSEGSVPGEIIVTEDPLEVQVIPVAVGHSLGAPCPPALNIETIDLPLEQPLGDRQLVVAPSGSVVNLPGTRG